jgi:hypothetical protein
MNDRVDADGKRVLFIEELQSDWAQQGRRNGFMPKDPAHPTDDEVKEYFALKEGANVADYREEMVADLNGRDRLRRARQKDAPLPRAPFVDKTDAWLSLALKRVIRLAAEEGYDRVAFVHGQQSADRYSLAKQVESIRWSSVGQSRTVGLKLLGGHGTETFTVSSNGIVEDAAPTLEGKPLEDVVGKAVAEKILGSRDGRIAGEGLKIGGEGMVAFYDKIVPAALGKLLPKLGGGKLGKVTFEAEPTGRENPDTTPISDDGNIEYVQPSFDVTPAMRELAGKGMPLFARGDAMPSGLNIQEARDRIRQMRGAMVSEVEPIVRQITAGWKAGPEVHVVATSADLPARLKAPAGVRGVHSHGEVWIVAAAHRRGADLREAVGSTLAHEAVAHYGLRKILGPDFDRLLTKQMRLAIASGNKPMRELRDFVRQEYRDQDGSYNLTAHQEADEMAALAVEKAVDANGEFRPGYSWLKSVWARVAQFLRDLGITVKFTNAELHGMLVQAMASLKAGNRLAGGARSAAAAAMGEPAQQARGELPEQNTLGGWAAPDDTLTDKFIYELQDGRVDLKRVQQAIAQAKGKVEERFDARLAETLYYGRVTRRTENFLNREAKPLLQAMARIGASLDELGDYLLARHAPERNEQIARVNPDLPDGGAGSNSKGELMTTDAAQAYIEAIPRQRRQLLEELAAYVDKITAGTRELLVSEGLEKRRTIDAWNAAYQHYVPLFKDEAGTTLPRTRRAWASRCVGRRASAPPAPRRKSPTCWRTC